MLKRMQEDSAQKGSILLMVLVLTGMVIVFLVSGVLYSGRQFNATVEQEEEERAFHAAEAGIHYTLYLLNSPLSGEDEFTLEEMGSWPQQTVYKEDTSEILGTYDLVFSPLEGGEPDKGLLVWSVGQNDSGRVCQLIRAEIRRISNLQAAYVVTQWDHRTECEIPVTPSASPSPSASI